MRWVIIGSSGYIGSALCRYLIDRGLPVLSLSRRNVGPAGSEHHQIAEYTESGFRGLFAPGDKIVYAAGLASISECRRKPDLADWLNCQLPAALLKLANGAGADSFLYFSSVKARKAPCGKVAGEEAGEPAADPYGLSKWRAEQLLLSCSGRVRVNVLRPAAVYGEYRRGVDENEGRGRSSHASGWGGRIKRLIGFLPIVPATGYRSVVALEELLTAVFLLEERLCNREVFIVSEPAYYDLAAISSAVSGRRIKSSHIGGALLMLPFYILSAFGIKAAFLDVLRSELYSAERLKACLSWRPRARYGEFLRGE
ncbi:NAD-dependent epimerase/dehydratase family protein [Microbulbifer pacificus]|uniref:NAD-dependent epimerase/dehydratase family protein n=1 Tax=Microbulbifer pacificus TaxID=407164 RepID=UPI000CF4F856|nr:NAD-dependent epimerase/dehydratase family protein [Microbulbifer pacificus]